MSDNVKSLFGGGAESSDRVKAIVTWVEAKLREVEETGAAIDGLVGVVFATRDGKEVSRTVWDVDSQIGRGRPVRGMIAIAALELSAEVLK